MKVGLKLATVVFPIPTIFWVLKGKHPIWVKILTTFWALITLIMLLGATQVQDGFSGYSAFIFASLISFSLIHGIFSLLKKAFHSVKNQTQSPIENSVIPEVSPKVIVAEQKQRSSPPVTNVACFEEQNNCIDVLTPRRQKALYKLALQILEDDEVDLEESKKLRAWLRRYPESKDDFRTQVLSSTVEDVLEDKILDSSEALELFALLSEYCDLFEKQEADTSQQKKEKALATKFKNSQNNPISVDSNYNFLKKLQIGQEYFISYKSANGEISERNVIVNKIDVNSQNQHYIKGHCLLRNSQRTFRADRIVTLCDVETGEAFV